LSSIWQPFGFHGVELCQVRDNDNFVPSPMYFTAFNVKLPTDRYGAVRDVLRDSMLLDSRQDVSAAASSGRRRDGLARDSPTEEAWLNRWRQGRRWCRQRTHYTPPSDSVLLGAWVSASPAGFRNLLRVHRQPVDGATPPVLEPLRDARAVEDVAARERLQQRRCHSVGVRCTFVLALLQTNDAERSRAGALGIRRSVEGLHSLPSFLLSRCQVRAHAVGIPAGQTQRGSHAGASAARPGPCRLFVPQIRTLWRDKAVQCLRDNVADLGGQVALPGAVQSTR
jgi:hypothetical protein